MIGNNLLAWSLQIAMLVAIAAVAENALRLGAPGARLLYWQAALLASLALPLVRPWKHAVVAAVDSVSAVTIIQTVHLPAHRAISLQLAVLGLLAAGMLARGVWLAAGFRRLRQYRRQSRWLASRDGAVLRLSEAVSSPVTFGAFRPVVLLPAHFPELAPAVQEAILCHELLHVRRRDWLFTVGEEIVRAVFWFHPAIWWLLAEIGLAREQEVDRQVVASTQSREQYVDALLAIAGGRPRPDLAPASLFLRKRHLKQRVVSILKEVRMSKTRLVTSLAAALSILVAACWLATATFPLAAAPQLVTDAPGVSVELGGATLVHRTAVDYPAAARAQGIQGTVTVQVKIDSSGSVSDAQVLSGPDELRKAALESVLNWHFTNDAAGSARPVSITFQLPPATAAPAAAVDAPSPLVGLAVQSISVTGISDAARNDVLARMPVHQGDVLTAPAIQQMDLAIMNVDQHLRVTYRTPLAGQGANLQSGREVAIEIAPGDTGPAVPGTKLRIPGNVQAMKLIQQPKPVYPVQAKQDHIQGVVKIEAWIGKDGRIQNLNVISGHPLLVPASLDAVRQWVYQPTLLNGEPVDVDTVIDVNFTLAY
jgi:TonB family protein